MVRVEVKGAGEMAAAVSDLEKKQLPFILAKTLTNTAQDAQEAVRSNVRKAFKLRNNWTFDGIRITPAQKKGSGAGRIEADVHTDTENRITGAPDYLVRQEEGGEKVPYGGRDFIAVPTIYLRQLAPGIIPEELRPRNLLGAVGDRYIHTGRRGDKRGQIALRNQKIVKGFVFFIQEIHDGHKAIMGRNAAARERESFPFYLLVPEVHVKKSQMEMVATVERVVNENFAKNWAQNWKDAYANGFKI